MGSLVNINEQITFTAHARCLWNDSGIDLIPDAVYEISAQGKWLYFFVLTGPAGYSGYLYQRRLTQSLRLPSANWFALCGTIVKNDKTTFAIGTSLRLIPESGGLLYCFVNDLHGWYWNNFLSVSVSVMKIE